MRASTKRFVGAAVALTLADVTAALLLFAWAHGWRWAALGRAWVRGCARTRARGARGEDTRPPAEGQVEKRRALTALRLRSRPQTSELSGLSRSSTADLLLLALVRACANGARRATHATKAETRA